MPWLMLTLFLAQGPAPFDYAQGGPDLKARVQKLIESSGIRTEQ